MHFSIVPSYTLFISLLVHCYPNTQNKIGKRGKKKKEKVEKPQRKRRINPVIKDQGS